jgi:hypothetical protein
MKTALLFIGMLLIAASIIAPKFFIRTAGENFETDATGRKHLKTIHNKAASLEHFDEDFEDLEDYEQEALEEEFFETFEHFKKKGANDSQARSAAHKKLSAKHGAKYTKAMKKAGSKSVQPGSVGANPFYDAAAQFDITVTRVTANIASALTVPLFASMHFDAKYLSIMGSYLPAGVTISSIAINSTGDVVFSLTDGVGTDTIKISCTQIPYITFLNALNYTAMKLSKVRYAISDITKLAQFNQPFETHGTSIFGKHGGNGLSLAAVNDPKSLNTGVRDLDNTIDINNETAVIVGIINTAGFSFCLSAFVQGYGRTNR